MERIVVAKIHHVLATDLLPGKFPVVGYAKATIGADDAQALVADVFKDFSGGNFGEIVRDDEFEIIQIHIEHRTDSSKQQARPISRGHHNREPHHERPRHRSNTKLRNSYAPRALVGKRHSIFAWHRRTKLAGLAAGRGGARLWCSRQQTRRIALGGI